MHLALLNIKWGPWSKSGFFKKIQECAQLISENLHANDKLLLLFYPEILRDRDQPQSDNDEEHRRAFLQSLPSLPFVKAKGPKASSGRFHSLVHSHEFLDDARLCLCS